MEKPGYEWPVDRIATLAGGPFKAAALMNLRLREIIRTEGARHGRQDDTPRLARVVEEVLDGRIALIPAGKPAEDAEEEEEEKGEDA